MTEQDQPEKNKEQTNELNDTVIAQEIDPKFLEFLVCPVTKTSLEYDKDNQELISRAARLAYPIRKGIPMMSPEEARKIDDD